MPGADTIRAIEWITIAAIVVGPIFAVLIGRHLQNRQLTRFRRESLFKDLMGTRRIGLHIDHVRALNMIDVEFASNSRTDVAVRDAWKLYLSVLADNALKEGAFSTWNTNRDKRFCDLLEKIALALKYPVQRSQIELGGYFPIYYTNLDNEQGLVRKGLIDLANGRAVLRIAVEPDPSVPGNSGEGEDGGSPKGGA